MSIYSDVAQSFAWTPSEVAANSPLPKPRSKSRLDAWLKNKRKKTGPRKRKAISNGKRFNIFNRDNFRCTYCGRSSSEDGVKLEVDHIIPVAKGGKNTEENLTTACYECNRGKNTKLLNTPLGKRKTNTTEPVLGVLLSHGMGMSGMEDGFIDISQMSGTSTLVLKADNEKPLKFGS
jgi:5-methylcytosine-specific restriction endonuclease McrA